MATLEVIERVGTEEGVNRAALTMAIGIVVERIRRLPEPDRDDLYDLVKGLATANSSEDLDSICAAMLEILDQRPVRVQKLDLAEQPPNNGLRRWLEFVSARLRELRKDSGLTQAQLAEKTGLPQSHISRLESGQHSPSHSTLQKIAAALNVPMARFDPSAD